MTVPPSAPSARLEQSAQLALVVLLIVGCWLVLEPFFSGILLALVLAVSTWPLYVCLRRRLGGRRALASVCACLLVIILAIIPVALLVTALADGAIGLLRMSGHWFGGEPPAPPDWLARLPLVGEQLSNWWRDTAASQARIEGLLLQLAEPARRTALASGRAIANGLLQGALATLLLFLLYRDGEALGRRVHAAAGRVGGSFGQSLLMTAQQTVVGVMFSVVGAALAQAMVATVGFLVAGLPNPVLLGALTFAASMVPVGPPVIWGFAAFWLFQRDATGWGIFMLLYGFLCISSIDNIVKPILISRVNRLPFAFTLMGVIGGVFAFGVMGVFLGPTLLALAINLSAHWLSGRDDDALLSPPPVEHTVAPPG